MAQILVRGIPDAVMARLRRRAKGNGRSLQAELRAILEQAARCVDVDAPAAQPKPLSPVEALRLADSIRRSFKGRGFTDAVESIREGRSRNG